MSTAHDDLMPGIASEAFAEPSARVSHCVGVLAGIAGQPADHEDPDALIAIHQSARLSDSDTGGVRMHRQAYRATRTVVARLVLASTAPTAAPGGQVWPVLDLLGHPMSADRAVGSSLRLMSLPNIARSGHRALYA